MHRLKLITSGSQRRLLSALADNISNPVLQPLERENIVVLSNGMARWISIELATIHGVSAGLNFTFPNDLLDSFFRIILKETQQFSHFTPDAMTWRIAALLPELAKKAEFGQIAAYLGNNPDDRRLLQISRIIAETFDQYTIFRPEMILDWDRGVGKGWQPLLWRAVSSASVGRHRAAMLDRCGRLIESGGDIFTAGIPGRISIFGISYLPPFHLEALRLLSAANCDVTCYLLNPCGQYWGNIISKRFKADMELRSNLPGEVTEYYETGNPLLSSLGTLGQEFFETLLDYGFESEELDDWKPYVETEGKSCLLATIQSDILTLNDRPAVENKCLIPGSDRSLQIHSCHGPMREMEILYDNILSMFDELEKLEPRQIVVMIPDIERYATYINAVFSSRSGGRPTLPYTISDRSVNSETPFVDSFFAMLDLASGRFGVNEVLGVLEAPPVIARLAVSEEELVSIRRWLSDSGILWGLDGEHRGALGFPPFADFSWQAGLDRLFIGYAMAPDRSKTFKNILPYASVGGSQTLALGKLAEFIRNIRQIHFSIGEPHTLTEWKDILSNAAANMLSVDDSSDNGPTMLAKALVSLSEKQNQSGFDRPITLDAVRDSLVRALTDCGKGYGFMGGAITFCAMLPMRSIPMRVVCLAGMNNGQFPRTSRQPGFSLMSGTRRRGDRSLRDEDRYLFLEALMSAEERLLISYDGQSCRDNSLITPSVLVSELHDYVNRCFINTESGEAPVILTSHRLQGFSEAYFQECSDSKLFSYDIESADALEARRLYGRKRRVFMNGPLLPESRLTDRIEVQKLKRFLSNPAAAFLENRLKIKPINASEEPEEREPFSLDRLSEYYLSQELVTQIISGASKEDCYIAARSRCILPPLSAGNAAFDAVWQKSTAFAVIVSRTLDDPLERLEIDLEIDAVRLCGLMDEINSGKHLRWRCAPLKGRDRLSIWIDHLLLNILRQNGYPRSSTMLSSDLVLNLPPVENAPEIMLDILKLYAEGMLRPLPFFPQSSWIFLTEGMVKAENHWRGEEYSDLPGESANASFSICFNYAEPLGEEFCQLANRLYMPLKNVAVESKLS